MHLSGKNWPTATAIVCLVSRKTPPADTVRPLHLPFAANTVQGLRGDKFGHDEVSYAAGSLRICRGFMALTAPLDAIQAYPA